MPTKNRVCMDGALVAAVLTAAALVVNLSVCHYSGALLNVFCAFMLCGLAFVWKKAPA